MRNIVFALLVLAACGDGDQQKPMDGALPIDVAAQPVTLDCNTYCTRMQENCRDANAQYADADHCMAACAAFSVGSSTVDDTSGNTLGCRIHYAVAARTAATSCAYAGPAGDLVSATTPAFCSGGSVCANFCALETRACGTVQAPLPGDPRDSIGNSIFQYQTMTNCVNQCANFDKSHAYSAQARGDSFACRLLQATTANVTADRATACPDTGLAAVGRCEGTATP